MPERILMITGIAGAESCAGVLGKQFQMTVETADSRKQAIAALRRHPYALVVIDESLLQADQDGDDALLRHTGLAIPIEINFAISGAGRLVREVRAALARRALERELAERAIASSIKGQLGELAAGLLLHAQLALDEPELPPRSAEKIRSIVELAAKLAQQLDTAAAGSLAPGRSAPVHAPIPLEGPRAKPSAMKPRAARPVSGSYASSAADNPSAGIRPGFPGL
jgi:hypothetical protein